MCVLLTKFVATCNHLLSVNLAIYKEFFKINVPVEKHEMLLNSSSDTYFIIRFWKLIGVANHVFTNNYNKLFEKDYYYLSNDC
jgi:hypothetical protein